MSIVEDEQAAEACRALVRTYHGHIDRGRATEAIHAFTPDARFEARGERLQGHDAILEFLANRQEQTDRHTVHLVAHDEVHEVSADELTLGALVLLYARRADGGYDLDRVLDTVHRFRRTPAGWRVTARSSAPLHPPVPQPATASSV